MTESYIYLISMRTRGTAFKYVVKFGVSIDPSTRLKELQTGCPFKLKLKQCVLVDNAYYIEKQIHNALQPYKLRGEWFGFLTLEEYRPYSRIQPLINKVLQGDTIKTNQLSFNNYVLDCVKKGYTLSYTLSLIYKLYKDIPLEHKINFVLSVYSDN